MKRFITRKPKKSADNGEAKLQGGKFILFEKSELFKKILNDDKNIIPLNHPFVVIILLYMEGTLRKQQVTQTMCETLLKKFGITLTYEQCCERIKLLKKFDIVQEIGSEQKTLSNKVLQEFTKDNPELSWEYHKMLKTTQFGLLFSQLKTSTDELKNLYKEFCEQIKQPNKIISPLLFNSSFAEITNLVHSAKNPLVSDGSKKISDVIEDSSPKGLKRKQPEEENHKENINNFSSALNFMYENADYKKHFEEIMQGLNEDDLVPDGSENKEFDFLNI